MKSSNRYDGIDAYVQSQLRYRARRLHRNKLMANMEVEDIEQDLLLDLLARSRAFDSRKAAWNTFVDRILVNKCASMLAVEKALRRGGNVPRVSLDGLMAEPEGSFSEPADETAPDPGSIHLGIDICRLAAGLPPALAALLQGLRHRSMTDIARNTGMPRATLYERLSELRGHLAPLEEYIR